MRTGRLGTLAIGLLVLGTQGCQREDDQPTIPKRVSVAFFDLSLSTDDSLTRSMYCDAFRQIVAQASHGEVIAAAWISQASAQEPRLPIQEFFPPFTPLTTNDRKRASLLALATDSLRLRKEPLAERVCGPLLRSDREVRRTEILSAMHVAQGIFDRYNGDSEILYLFSDMVEDSDEYNFDRMDLTAEKIAEIIGQETTQGLPHLAGVQVQVAGASSSLASNFEAVRDFWLAYFDAAGASINSSSYGGPFLGPVPLSDE